MSERRLKLAYPVLIPNVMAKDADVPRYEIIEVANDTYYKPGQLLTEENVREIIAVGTFNITAVKKKER